MKKFLLLFVLLLAYSVPAQDKMSTVNGIIFFEASVPLFEAVEAKNSKVASVLDPKKGGISYEIFIKDFNFERSLMQEHFNTNYLESKRYPKATFKGLIEKFDLKNIKNFEEKYTIKGKITIHGKSKNISVLAFIKKTKNQIQINSKFSIDTDDFGIKIPTIIRSKISKNVNINVITNLE